MASRSARRRQPPTTAEVAARRPFLGNFWAMREQYRVAFVGIILLAVYASVVLVAVHRISAIEGNTDVLADQALPARDRLLAVSDGLRETQVAFVQMLAEPDKLTRTTKLEDTRKQLSVTESAWRDYRAVSLNLPCEEGRATEYEALKRRQDELAPAVGLAIVEGDDIASLLQSDQLRELQETMGQEQRIAGDLLDNCYQPYIDEHISGAVTAVDDARTEVFIFFGVALGLLILIISITWRTARVHEAEAEAREAERALQERRNELEASLQRALAMTRAEDEAFQIVRGALTLGNPGTPTELLVADSSEAHFRQVLSTDPSGGPGCPVVSPTECPAAQGGDTRVFLSSTSIDSCPNLRDRPTGSCSAVCVPVSIAGRSVAVLHTTAPDQEPPPEEVIGNVELIGARAGDRIGLLRAMAESETQARSDPLTGLLNRRSLENAVRRLAQRGTAYVVAFGDLDHFKRLNDSNGHDAGDRALRLFTRALRDSVRPNDLVCRYGGEEFLIVLPDCDLGDAAEIVERVRRALADTLATGVTPPFTVSFGLAESSQGETFDQIVGLADRALLAAKAAGRDRVLIAGEFPDQPANAADERGDASD